MTDLLFENLGIESALGTYLVESGKVTEEDLIRTQSLPELGYSGLGQMLSNTGLVSDQDIANAYSTILDLPLYEDTSDHGKPLSSTELKESYLRSALLLPVAISDTDIKAATANPEDHFALEALRLSSGKTLTLMIATKQQVEKGLDALFEKEQSAMDGILEKLDSGSSIEDEHERIERLRDQAGEAPVVKLVNLIIQKAIDSRASDIHIEAFENQVRIRYRVDGILRIAQSPPTHSIAAIISRIKLMAKMNIAEKRLPQDGGFQVRLQGKLVDIRVSTSPTLHGESLVLRILDQHNVMLDLSELGFSEHYYQQLQKILTAPNGIVLVTGPTGSGKTTTLYAALQILNTDQRKIMTVEDPVEYQIHGINQIQIKPDINLDFAQSLRSIVRQDPDIIMIGEMRDLETARTAVQSALTGHLVLSTLHTNDAGSTITRLLDMGIEGYLVTSTVTAIIAQRLVRKLCSCKTPYVAPQSLIKDLKLNELSEEESTTLYKATGCPACENTGYKGRVVISEILEFNDAIRERILEGCDGSTLQNLAVEHGMTPMAHDGIKKALKGITTIEEVTRVTFV